MQNRETKKVLIITYYWPPSGGAGVQRWLKFTKYLPEYGWTPVIYTPENPEAPATDTSLFKDIPESAIIIKRPIWEPYLLYKWFTGKSKNEKINAGFLSEKKTNPILERFSVFIRGNFFIPDARKFWINPSVRYLKKYLKDNPVDIIVSTGPPHSMHLIALKLKKCLNIKWIADFRDPWTNIDFYKDLRLLPISDKKHRFLEKEVLTNADYVIAIGETFAQELELLGAKKVDVITNGFDDEDLPSNKPQLDSNFSIVHLGAINKDRNHPVFWEAINELVKENTSIKENLKIIFIGKVDNAVFHKIDEMKLSQFVEHIKYIPHEQVLNELCKARLLLLPINNTPNSKGIVTGKLFEYMASNRPILAIGPTDGDISVVLKKSNAGRIYDYNDITGIKEYIAINFKLFNENSEIKENANINLYSRRMLTSRLINILEKLLVD